MLNGCLKKTRGLVNMEMKRKAASWDDRAKTYLKWSEGFSPQLIKRNLVYIPFLRYMLARKIREINPRSILEIGCGPGHWFDLYKNRLATCVDYSEKMLERAREVCRKRRYSNIEVLLMNACDLQFVRSFNLAISASVMLHIPPGKVEDVVVGLSKCASEVLVVEWVDPDGVDVGNCHLHDYPFLFSEQGYELIDARAVPFYDQMLYHFRRR
jgi:SAM-dependent methyltransferase